MAKGEGKKILGIDPGTGILGWGIVISDGRSITPLKYGVIRTRANSNPSHRLRKIYQGLNGIIEINRPDEIAIEDLFFFKNQKTVISVAQARGVAMVVGANSGIEVHEYTPLQVKQALTGYGRADKKQVQEMVKSICGLKKCPKPDDAADGLAVAICHGQTNFY